MRNIFIIEALTTQTTVGAVAAMTAREVMIVGDSKEVITDLSTAASLKGLKSINFITKTTNGNLRTSVPIPRLALKDFSMQVYNAPVNKVVTLGSGVAGTSLVIPTEGTGELTIRNLSYNHAISTQRVNYTATKKSTETAVAFIDRVVVELNAANAALTTPMYTVTKLGTTDLGLQFTCANEHIDLAISRDGIFATAGVVTTVQAVVSTGKGVDVQYMEDELAKHQGKGGYIENADAFYKQPLESKSTENYDIVTLTWEGISPTPTNTIKVATNTFSFAFPEAADPAKFITALELIIGNTYTVAGGALVKDVDQQALDHLDNN